MLTDPLILLTMCVNLLASHPRKAIIRTFFTRTSRPRLTGSRCWGLLGVLPLVLPFSKGISHSVTAGQMQVVLLRLESTDASSLQVRGLRRTLDSCSLNV